MTKHQRKIYTTPVDATKYVRGECNCKKNYHYCCSKCKDKAWKKEAEQIEMAYAVTPTGEDDTKQGLVGLFNLGATCFMNSALQCLSHTDVLRKYFIDFKLYKKDRNKNNPMASTDLQITEQLVHTLNLMWKKQRRAQFPYKMKKAIGTENSIFAGYHQQDANEFLQFILSKLDDDLNRVKPILVDEDTQKYSMPYIQYPPDEYAEILLNESEEKLVQLFDDINLEMNQSIINDCMMNEFKSTIRCQECGFYKIMMEKMNVVPVNICEDNLSLEASIILYGKEETLSKEEANFFCRKCNDMVGIFKSQRFHRTAPILIFCLQRFKNNQKMQNVV